MQETCSFKVLGALWRPPDDGELKVNFDPSKLDVMGSSFGFVVGSSEGNVVLDGVHQQARWQGERLLRLLLVFWRCRSVGGMSLGSW